MNSIRRSLETGITTLLNLDPESTHRLQKLSGNIITIELLPFHVTFQCHFTSKGIHIKTDHFLEADTTIRGTPLQMMGMMVMKNSRQRFFADDVIVEGNAEIGQDVIALFDEFHVDWEEYLSHLIGDIPAHHTGRLVKGIRDIISHAGRSFRQNMSDYIHEEKEWLPQREALQDFFNDIDALRMDVDRTEAKIRELTNQLAK